MTDNRVTVRAGTLRHATGTALLLTGLALAGCSHQPAGPAASKLRVYAADLSGGAKVCEVPAVTPKPGASTGATMKMMNDGGWCGISVHQDGPKPFEAGLLTTRPNHGDVLIHEVGDDTRIDYTPDRGFVGNDTFAVKLIPGDAAIQAAVTVTAPPQAAGSPAAATPTPAASAAAAKPTPAATTAPPKH
jgi:hypothetical protein